MKRFIHWFLVLLLILSGATFGLFVFCSDFRHEAIGPDAHIETQIIVGFPGEQDSDLDKTIEFLRAAELNSIQIFRYSDRSRTEAAKMSDKVSESVKLARAKRLEKEFKQTSILIV